MAREVAYRSDDSVCFDLNNSIAYETSPSRTSSRCGTRKVSGALGEEVVKTDGLGHQLWHKPSFGMSRQQISPVTSETEDQRRQERCDSPSALRVVKDALFKASQRPQNRGGAPIRKRKEGVTDLAMDLMTTVQETSMDSPTIPGRPPIDWKSRMSPKTYQQKILNRESLTPRTTKTGQFGSEGSDILFKPVDWSMKAERRASSILLPNGLAPLVIPTNDQYTLPAQAYRPLATEEGEGLPPKVPPKSPNTLIRAFPQPRKTPSSATTCSSASHTANSSVTSFSTLDSRASPKPWATPIRGQSPFNPYRKLSVAEAQSPLKIHRKLSAADMISPKPWNTSVRGHSPLSYHTGSSTTDERASPIPWGEKEMNGLQLRHERNQQSMDEKISTKQLSGLRNGTNLPGHYRVASEPSIINRGRPTKRGDLALQRTPSGAIKMADLEDDTVLDLPVGFRLADAASNLSYEEMRLLKIQAQDQVARFELLQEKHVSSLSKELRLLDERCEYLRITHTSLREGRSDLQKRMMTFLKSPRTATFTRENMIKQEKALAELDTSINDWLMKLSQADNRRQRIRQKLLEHIAAALVLDIPSSPSMQRMSLQQTPPRSPEATNRSFSTERRDVESIRVYADSGVASLLASIEQELCNMGDHGCDRI